MDRPGQRPEGRLTLLRSDTETSFEQAHIGQAHEVNFIHTSVPASQLQTLPHLDLPHLDSHRRKISCDEINTMAVCQYSGNIVLVQNEEALNAAVEHLKQEDVLGFDTETRPVFKKGKSYPPSLVQLAASNVVYIFQLLHVPFDERLAAILASPSILKVGVAVHDDIRELQKTFEFTTANVLDLSQVARRNKLETHGLRNLAANFFDIRIPKGARCSNWAAKKLNKKQLLYAATDAWIGRELYFKMRQKGLVFE